MSNTPRTDSQCMKAWREDGIQMLEYVVPAIFACQLELELEEMNRREHPWRYALETTVEKQGERIAQLEDALNRAVNYMNDCGANMKYYPEICAALGIVTSA